MYRLISKLIIYKNLPKDCLLFELADIIRDFDLSFAGRNEEDSTPPDDVFVREAITNRIYTQINRLLDIATEYGFNRNLWHNYLTYLLVTTENPFSITCEKTGAKEGTVNDFAKNDFKIFKALFDYDFAPLEQKLGINCFSVISDYDAIEKSSSRYNKSVSEKVQLLSRLIEQAQDEHEIFRCVTEFYRDYGVGMFGLNKAFRISKVSGQLEMLPITNTQEVRLTDLVGYELQKKKLVDNTKAFVEAEKRIMSCFSVTVVPKSTL
jgi:hypothetical protein